MTYDSEHYNTGTVDRRFSDLTLSAPYHVPLPTATPLPLWAVGRLGQVNTIADTTESCKRYWSHKIRPCRTQCSRGLRHGSAAVLLLGLLVRTLPVSCESCVLSGRCLCDWPTPLPEESYRMCVTQCYQVQQQPSTPTVSGKKGVRLTENKKRICVVTGLEWPRGLQEVRVPRLHANGTGWW
jgi:hypothetical protein